MSSTKSKILIFEKNLYNFLPGLPQTEPCKGQRVILVIETFFYSQNEARTYFIWRGYCISVKTSAKNVDFLTDGLKIDFEAALGATRVNGNAFKRQTSPNNTLNNL